jgi:hypothetical protein
VVAGAGAAATGSPFCGPQAVTTMAAHSALATTPGVYQLFVFMLLPFAAGTGRLMRRDGRAMAGETLSPGASS